MADKARPRRVSQGSPSNVDKYTEIMGVTKNMVPLDGLYLAPIDKLGPVGRYIRHQLLNASLLGTPVLVAIQKHRTLWLDKIMHFLSFLGTEEFYTPLIIMLAWVFDVRLARLFTVLMGVGFYCATATKNILRLPRPPCPPVQVLEKTQDWAMPSLHSVIGVCLPWYIWSYVYLHYQFSSQANIFLFCLIAFWSFSVMCSRVYLGVHSPADIVMGGIIGVTLLSIYLHVDDYVYHFISHGNNVILQVVVYYVAILAVHPGSDPPTHSYGETVTCNCVALGMIIALQRTVGYQAYYYTALLEQKTLDDFSVMHIVLLSAARLLVGVPVVLGTRIVAKYSMRYVTFLVLRLLNIPAYSYTAYSKTAIQLNKHHNDDFKLPPVLSGKKHAHGDEPVLTRQGDLNGDMNGFTIENGCGMPLDIDTPTKFVTYSIMGWVALEGVHHIFHYLNLVL